MSEFTEYIRQFYKGKEILITGGTGSLGKTLVKLLVSKQIGTAAGIRIFSRDEEKHRSAKKLFKQYNETDTPISFLIGDVRDYERVKLACRGVDVLIHAAAMKQIPSCEENPIEAVRTNVGGAENVVLAATENVVEYVMNVSTDKACHPANLYGSTKMSAEKLIELANVYSPHTRFSSCRYGNVLNSRGSVLQVFRECAEAGHAITIFGKNMTRFWIKLEDAAAFILSRIPAMHGGEIFIPHMKAAYVIDILRAMFDDKIMRKTTIVFARPRIGEKEHECIITEQEAAYTVDQARHTIIDTKRNPYSETLGEYKSSKALQYKQRELKKIIQEVLQNE